MGRILEEVFQASDEGAARERLEGRGYHVFELRREGALSVFRREEGKAKLSLPRLRKRTVSDREFLLFNQELASLLKAGLPLVQSLELLLERQRNPLFKEVLTDIRARVTSGEELSSAFGSYGRMFPALYAPTVQAGERSGELESVIRRFVRYLKLVLDTRRRIVSAMVYPSVLFVLSLAMLLVMVYKVIPSFKGFFVQLDVELPWITQQLLGFSEFLQSRPGLLAVGTLIVFLVVGFRWTRTGAGRTWLDTIKLGIPVFGGIQHRFALSEFCRSLATLLSGGLPLVPSLETSVSAVSNSYLRGQLGPVSDAVREGAGASPGA